MVEKSRAIILNQIKYSDSGIIVRSYTRKFGRLSFIIKGMRKGKTWKHNSLFQPMFILDLEIYYRSMREIHMIRESSVSFAPYNIHSDVRKSCVAIFLGEILMSVLREESPNEELFDFIEESIIFFDGCRENYANFHISFLSGLSSYLGFQANIRRNDTDIFFDLVNGEFTSIPPVHGSYAGEAISEILAGFFTSSYETAATIPLTGAMRNEVLDTLISYYSHHLPGLRKINSLEVLREVYG